MRSVNSRNDVVVRVAENSRFADGTVHLELVRLVALGHRHIVLDLTNLTRLDEVGLSDLESWHHVLAYKGGRLRLRNVAPAIVEQLGKTDASAAIEKEPGWSAAAGDMSLGAWARMRRKQS